MQNPYLTPRQDLLASPYNFTGFIAEQVLPTLNVMQWSGSIPMVLADVTTGASGRDGAGNVLPNRANTNIVPFDISRTGGGEIIDREVVGVEQIAMYGSKEAADRRLAQTGILRTKTSVEVAVRTAAVSLGYINVSAAPIADVFGGLLSIVQSKKGYGKVIIAGSYAALNVIRGLAEVKSRMLNIGGSPGRVREVTDENLAEVFTADGVIQAESPGTPIWLANELIVLVKPDPAIHPSMLAQVGRFINYTWVLDGQNWVLTCEELFNPSTRDSVLDFVTYGKAYIANPAFIQAVQIA